MPPTRRCTGAAQWLRANLGQPEKLLLTGYSGQISLAQLAFAGIALPNAGSVGLHEAVGFERVGVFRNAGHKLGREGLLRA